MVKKKNEYSISFKEDMMKTLARNEVTINDFQKEIDEYYEREKIKESEEKERKAEHLEAVDRYNKKMRTGTEERKLDSEKLWKCILELHLTQIKKDLRFLSQKKQQYHRVGDNGEEIIDSSGWDMQLRYYIGDVLCNKGGSDFPISSLFYKEGLDNLVLYLIEENLKDPTITHFFEKYEKNEPRPALLNIVGDDQFDKTFSTCYELKEVDYRIFK